MKKVFLFPGQGSQYPGMAKKLFMKYDYAKKIIEHSNNILEYDIKDIDENLYLNVLIFAKSNLKIK